MWITASSAASLHFLSEYVASCEVKACCVAASGLSLPQVRHAQRQPAQADDGADQALSLAERQAEHGSGR
jgi:hypothetical protein